MITTIRKCDRHQVLCLIVFLKLNEKQFISMQYIDNMLKTNEPKNAMKRSNINSTKGKNVLLNTEDK